MISAKLDRYNGKGFTSLVLSGDDAAGLVASIKSTIDRHCKCVVQGNGDRWQVMVYGKKKATVKLLTDVAKFLGIDVFAGETLT